MIAIIWWYLIFPVLWIWAATSLFRRIKEGTHARKAIVFLSLTLWYPVMFWDDILGYWQWRSICAREAGIKIYSVVELTPDHFDHGMPKYKRVPTPQGAKESRDVITDQIEWRSVVTDSYTPWPYRTIKYYNYIVDLGSNKLLGESTTFSRYRGGPPRPVPDGYGEFCATAGNQSTTELLHSVFKQKEAK